MAEKKFLMGNEVLGRAARAAHADAMFGYPITPSSEIMHYWAGYACSEEGKKDGVRFLQAEDEVAAGFMIVGGALAGGRVFTATAGPGHVLMQDGLSMAEAMRIPVVVYVMQRGGPSTSTVIYSQSEVNLACYGGNGNGFRIVYSPSNLQELYDYGIKVFETAWKHRFPTILLGDGYLAKTMGEVELYSLEERGLKPAPAEPYLMERKRKRKLEDVFPSPELYIRHGDDGTEYACLRNCLNLEEETLAVNEEIKAAFDEAAKEVTEHETFGDKTADTLIVAHGIVSAAAKSAIAGLKNRKKARLFRPITLRPFPDKELRKAMKGVKRLVVVESAYDQLGRSVKSALVGMAGFTYQEYMRPSMGILPEEIAALVRR